VKYGLAFNCMLDISGSKVVPPAKQAITLK